MAMTETHFRKDIKKVEVGVALDWAIWEGLPKEVACQPNLE